MEHAMQSNKGIERSSHHHSTLLPVDTALPGLALLGAIGGSLATALVDLRGRETALITFLATAANITLFGLGGAFWGLAAGLVAHGLIHGDFRLSRWFPRLSRSN